MMRFRAATGLALPLLLAVLAGCGDDPALPAGPAAQEDQVLRDAAEMLPPEDGATPSASPRPAAPPAGSPPAEPAR